MTIIPDKIKDQLDAPEVVKEVIADFAEHFSHNEYEYVITGLLKTIEDFNSLPLTTYILQQSVLDYSLARKDIHTKYMLDLIEKYAPQSLQAIKDHVANDTQKVIQFCEDFRSGKFKEEISYQRDKFFKWLDATNEYISSREATKSQFNE